MANSIALAKAYLKDTVGLNEVAKKALLTVDLEAPKVSFVGVKTVKLPKISFGSGLGTYSRSTGFQVNDLTLEWDEYTLTQEKGDTLKLDKFDDEEGLGGGVVPYVNQYIRRVEVPAVDAYRFAKLFQGGYVKGSTVINENNVLGELLAGFERLEEKEFDTNNLILFITPRIDTLFQTSTSLSKYIRVDERTENEVNTKVRLFNEAKIIVVPSNRFPQGANFILVDPSAVMGVVKHDEATLYEKVPGFRGGQVDISLYHDFFVISERRDGVYCNTAGVGTEVVVVSFNVDGGSYIQPQLIFKNGKATQPADPVKENYVFDGWFNEGGLTTPADFNTAISANKTFYAKWESA